MAILSFSCSAPFGSIPTPSDSSNNAVLGVRQKQHLIHELIEGRWSLLEAVARFRAIHQRTTGQTRGIKGILDLSTDSEGLCREVIGWVDLELSDRPEQAEVVTSRLESELQQVLDRQGTVRLPSIN